MICASIPQVRAEVRNLEYEERVLADILKYDDDSRFDFDVDLVVTNSKCSRGVARAALRRNGCAVRQTIRELCADEADEADEAEEPPSQSHSEATSWGNSASSFEVKH